jgi:hypothetical protein
MNIEGKYRDILSRNGATLVDTGWNSNAIVADYGRFLAALMKKDFEGQVGIEYMAVGGSDEGASEFKTRVEKFFNKEELTTEDEWVWAKKIYPDDMTYLDTDGNEISDPKIRTNKLRIDVTFAKNEPPGGDSDLREFALLGIYEDSGGTFDTSRMFFVNYVWHGLITKDESTELTRTVILTFPVKDN